MLRTLTLPLVGSVGLLGQQCIDTSVMMARVMSSHMVLIATLTLALILATHECLIFINLIYINHDSLSVCDDQLYFQSRHACPAIKNNP